MGNNPTHHAVRPQQNATFHAHFVPIILVSTFVPSRPRHHVSASREETWKMHNWGLMNVGFWLGFFGNVIT